MQKYALITGSAGLLGKYHAEALLQLNLKYYFADKKNLKPLLNILKSYIQKKR